MKRKLLTISATIIFSLTGCVSQPTYENTVRSEINEVQRPETGVIVKASLGERLLESGYTSSTTVDMFTLPADVSAFDVTIKAGEYKHTGNINGSKSFTNTNPALYPTSLGLPAMTPIFVDKKTGELCISGSFGVKPCSDFKPIVESRTTHNGYSKDGFVQELIYTGKSNDTIRFSYREFSGDMARPAFTVPVEYDLKEDPVIAYQGAVIEVLEATNRSITYKVINHFN